MHGKNILQTTLIFIPVFLMGLGIIMIYSSSSIAAAEKFNDGAYFLKKQFLFGTCGIICMLIMMRIPYSRLKQLAYPLWLASILMLVAVLMPGIGTEVGGAVRWLRFGPFSFQPSELAKLALVILIAYSLEKKDIDKLKCFSIGILPHLIIFVPVCALIVLQPDFGTSMMLMAFMLVMLFASGVSKPYLIGLGIIAGGAAGGLIACKGYRYERLLAFLNPWEHASGAGFQIVQSFLAFGSGGLLGTGLGRGTQKLYYLPEPHTDFILSVIGEELGFMGVVLVICLFAAVMVCGLIIALKAEDMFGSILALGIVTLLGLQTAINMGVVMGLLPTKGMPLPFVSYGGTSLLINLIFMGILLSISEQCSLTQHH